jgi:hypothetical protein
LEVKKKISHLLFAALNHSPGDPRCQSSIKKRSPSINPPVAEMNLDRPLFKASNGGF